MLQAYILSFINKFFTGLCIYVILRETKDLFDSSTSIIAITVSFFCASSVADPSLSFQDDNTIDGLPMNVI